MSRYKVYDTNLMTIHGVWQDGLELTRVTYASYLSDAILGTHVGNYPKVLYHLYNVSTYGDWTYNASYCGEAETYTVTYGATYSAVYHRSTYCNVRNLEWI